MDSAGVAHRPLEDAVKLDCGAFADAFTEPGITPNLLTEIAPLCGPRARA